MNDVSQKERAAQDRVIKLFTERLDYTNLGNWEDEERSHHRFPHTGANQIPISRRSFFVKSMMIWHVSGMIGMQADTASGDPIRLM